MLYTSYAVSMDIQELVISMGHVEDHIYTVLTQYPWINILVWKTMDDFIYPTPFQL